MKEEFYKLFVNIPIPERSLAIYVSQKYGPMSWNVVKLEVDQNTELGLEALEALKRMNII